MTVETTSSGRLFYIRGTSTEKATLPTADSLTGAKTVTTLYAEITEAKMFL